MKLNVKQILDPFTNRINYLYSFTNTKNFLSGKSVDETFVLKAFNFAYGMSFGNEGHHRDTRSGGSHPRKNGEKFADTFQGKLAEFAFWQELKKNSIDTHEPDINKEPKGKWDTADFEFNNYKIAVKSTKSFGQLLLLETADWDNEGLYIPNKELGHAKYDFIVLIRVKPHISDLLSNHRLLYSNHTNKNSLMEIVLNNKFEYDIPGFITQLDLQAIIAHSYIIPKGTFLSRIHRKTKMDAENYYIQTGNLKDISEFYKILLQNQQGFTV